MNNITAVASACFLATLASAQSEPAGDALTRHIRELAGEAIYERGSPGVAIGLIANGQRRVHGFGELSTGSERSIDANSVFEIGSITKVVTCLALAMMSSDAGLSLEEVTAAYKALFTVLAVVFSPHASERILATEVAEIENDRPVGNGLRVQLLDHRHQTMRSFSPPRPEMMISPVSSRRRTTSTMRC